MNGKRWILGCALSGLLLMGAQAQAAIEFFGTAKVKPTVYTNFDFQDGANDKAIVNEGGLTKGEHIRGELRLGWKAEGDKWKVKMIAEADVVYEKDTADRSYYIGAEKYNSPNTGGEFGIERVELLYAFLPQLELETGWDIRALDIKTGGLLYGDDHPFIGFRGNLGEQAKYELLYIPIQNNISFYDKLTMETYDDPRVLSDEAADANDWRVYSLKLAYTIGATKPAAGEFGLTLSPIYAYSDNDSKMAQINYYGLEITGTAGPIKPFFEIVGANGQFDSNLTSDGSDISSWAMFAGAEMPVCKAFNPYIAFRYTQGDDDATDKDVEGWVGITDIGRFAGPMAMDGGILGEDLGQSYGATLYSYSPERSLASHRYGGIGNAGSGDNPGQKLFAVGARGDLASILPNLMYKTQAFFIWYDETGNLDNKKTPGKKVDDYAGTTFDLQLMYAFSKNFSVDYIFGTFLPGDGIEDQFGDDPAFVNALTLAWTY